MNENIKATLKSLKSEYPVFTIGHLDYASRLTDSGDTQAHAHEFIEFFYIISGEIDHQMDGKREHLTLGDSYLIFPGHYHKFDRSVPCIHRDITISVDRFKRECDQIDRDLYDLLSQKEVLKINMSLPDIQYLEDKTNKYSNSDDYRYYSILKSSILSTIIEKAYSQLRKVTVTNANERNVFLNAINDFFLSKDYMEKIRERLGYTNSYLCHKFKNIFGVTLSDYIKKKRVEHASYLLVYTNKPVDEIVDEVGLDSRNYFNKIFKEHYGKTPTQYRSGK